MVTVAAGCASKQVVQPAGLGVGAVSPTGVATASGTYRQTAAQAAARMLESFIPPAGAKSVSGEPAGGAAGMSGADAFEPNQPDWVESTGWWVVDKSPTALETWLKSELPKVLPGEDGSGSGSDGTGLLMVEQIQDLNIMSLYEEQLDAQIGTYTGGESVLRLDAVAYYRPMRTAAENISNVVSVTVMLLSGAQVDQTGAPTPDDSATVTDQSKVSAIAALLNALPTTPDAPYGCPNASTAKDLRLVFHAASASAPQVQADLALTGCQGTSVEVGGAHQPELDGAPAAEIGSILGVDWDLTSGSAAMSAG